MSNTLKEKNGKKKMGRERRRERRKRRKRKEGDKESMKRRGRKEKREEKEKRGTPRIACHATLTQYVALVYSKINENTNTGLTIGAN